MNRRLLGSVSNTMKLFNFVGTKKRGREALTKIKTFLDGWSENEENTSASNVYGPFAFKLPFRSTIPIRQCCLRNISKFIP